MKRSAEVVTDMVTLARLHAALDALSDKFGEGTVRKADLADREAADRWPSHRRRDRG